MKSYLNSPKAAKLYLLTWFSLLFILAEDQRFCLTSFVTFIINAVQTISHHTVVSRDSWNSLNNGKARTSRTEFWEREKNESTRMGELSRLI